MRLGLARSRAHASELIATGQVRVDGIPARKPSVSVAEGSRVELTDPTAPTWVGRGADKLTAALDRFAPAGLTVLGRNCLDVGASTGGFTQVLLHRGAGHVVALDVGHGQLAPVLATDPRVTERSGVNIRAVGTDPGSVRDLGGPFDLLVADLSFISLGLVVEVLAALVDPHGDLVLLVKPQFEVGRERLGKGGIVRSAEQRLQAVRDVVAAAAAVGLGLRGLIRSPRQGAGGNQEYLGWWTPRTATGSSDPAERSLLDELARQEGQAPARPRNGRSGDR